MQVINEQALEKLYEEWSKSIADVDLLIYKKDINQALVAMEDAIYKSPSEREKLKSYTKKVEVLFRKDDLKKALEAADCAMEILKLSKSRQNYQIEEVLLLQMIAKVRLAIGGPDGVLQALQNATAANDIAHELSCTDEHVKIVATGHLLIGECHFRRGCEDIAIDDFSYANMLLDDEISENALDCMIWLMRCSLFQRLKFVKKALKMAKKVAPDQTKKIVALFMGGNRLYQRIR